MNYLWDLGVIFDVSSSSLNRLNLTRPIFSPLFNSDDDLTYKCFKRQIFFPLINILLTRGQMDDSSLV